ncbi:MAG: hypothetical protein ACQEXJ_12445 [Myxococcota bacterium]
MTEPEAIDEVDRSGGLARRVRMGMALELTGVASREEAAALPRWLRMQPAPSPDESEDPADLMVVVSADLGRVEWRAAGVPERFADSAGEVLSAVGAADSAWDDLGEAGEALGPEQLGTWLQVSDQGLDGGWLVGGGFPVGRALAHAPAGDAADALGRWAARSGASACLQLRSSAAPDHPATELSIPLPAGERAHQLAVAEQAFVRLGVPWIGDALGDALGRGAAEDEDLMLEVSLAADGPVRAAVLAPEPSTDVVLALVEAIGGVRDEALAELEGVLGADAGPAWIACSRYARRIDVELYYLL